MVKYAESNSLVVWYSPTQIHVKTLEGSVTIDAEIVDADEDIPYVLYNEGIIGGMR